jgi:hypothetical protein
MLFQFRKGRKEERREGGREGRAEKGRFLLSHKHFP